MVNGQGLYLCAFESNHRFVGDQCVEDRFIYQLDDGLEERIKLSVRYELTGRELMRILVSHFISRAKDQK